LTRKTISSQCSSRNCEDRVSAPAGGSSTTQRIKRFWSDCSTTGHSGGLASAIREAPIQNRSMRLHFRYHQVHAGGLQAACLRRHGKGIARERRRRPLRSPDGELSAPIPLTVSSRGVVNRGTSSESQCADGLPQWGLRRPRRSRRVRSDETVQNESMTGYGAGVQHHCRFLQLHDESGRILGG
jgi:hypothetical protein